jgi:hypothetical protein
MLVERITDGNEAQSAVIVREHSTDGNEAWMNLLLRLRSSFYRSDRLVLTEPEHAGTGASLAP